MPSHGAAEVVLELTADVPRARTDLGRRCRRPGRAVPEWAPARGGPRRPRPRRLVDRRLDDLADSRTGRRPARPGRFLAAGTPWFLTLFGRDSLWAARMLLPFGTDLALGTLRVLARRQGTRGRR